MRRMATRLPISGNGFLPTRHEPRHRTGSIFLPPPLFVLGRVSSSVSGSAFGPTTTVLGNVNVTGQEWVKCNLTDPSDFSIIGAGSLTNPLQTNGYALLQARAVLSTDNSSTPNITITPTAEVNGNTLADPETKRPTGSGSVSIGVAARSFPLTLAAPAPFSLPMLGDGSNQFFYSDDGNVSYLFIPGEIQARYADVSDMQWLIDGNRVGWSFHKVDTNGDDLGSGIPGMLGYSKQALGDSIIPISGPLSPYYNHFQSRLFYLSGLTP